MAIAWNQPHKGERPQDFLDERCEKGLFRCDRCASLWPLPVRWQDGFRLCQRCWDPLSAVEATVLLANEKAANASAPFEMLEFPVTGDSDGVPCVTGITPLTLNLTRGGASGSIAIVGVNLSSADTWTSPGVGGTITVTPTVNSTTSVTLSISAAVGVTRGNYSIVYNLSTLIPRGILKVR